jgi:ribosomal protein S18 acetylase RimI-like enzyme
LNPTLYFLRSSEQKIAKDMTSYAYTKDKKDLDIYYKYYGLNSSDLGLYALVNDQIAGASWIRYIDNKAILSVAVKPSFKESDIAKSMLDQLFLEAGAIYDALHVELDNNANDIDFFKDLGFIQDENPATMIKKIEKKEVVRPTDGYDPTRWMD